MLRLASAIAALSLQLRNYGSRPNRIRSCVNTGAAGRK